MAFRVSVAYQPTAVHRQICREIRSVWLLIPVHAAIMTVGGASCVYSENHGHLGGFRRAAGSAVCWTPHCLWSHDWMGMFAWPTTLRPWTTSGLNKPELFFKKLPPFKSNQVHAEWRASAYTVLTSLFLHRRRHLPSGLWTNRTPPRWLRRRSQPCQAPPLRSWNRRRRFQKGRLWMKSDQVWIPAFEF